MLRWRTLPCLLAVVLAASACGGLGGGQGDPNEITVWHTESTPTTVNAFQEIIDAYEQQHPGVHIEQEQVAWGDLQIKLQAALSAGDPPELTQVEPMFVRTLQDHGVLRPLDGVVDALGDDYLPELREMFAYPDGHDYGVVHAWGTDQTVYRKDLYAAAGAETPEHARTWDQWRDQLDQVAAADPDVSALSLAGATPHNVNEEVYLWLGSNGGHLFDAEGRPTIDTPEMVETLEFWRSLRQGGALASDWASAQYADTLARLAEGQAATVLSFGRAVYTFQEQAPELVEGDQIGIAPNKPVGPSGEDWITQLDAEPWVAFKDAAGSDQAVDFLKFFYQHDNYLKWVETVPTQLLPVTESMFDDPAYTGLPEVRRWGFWIDIQREVLASGRARPLMVVDQRDLELPYLSDLYGSGLLADMAKQVVEQGVDPADAADEAQQRAEELLSGRYQD